MLTSVDGSTIGHSFEPSLGARQHRTMIHSMYAIIILMDELRRSTHTRAMRPDSFPAIRNHAQITGFFLFLVTASLIEYT